LLVKGKEFCNCIKKNREGREQEHPFFFPHGVLRCVPRRIRKGEGKRLSSKARVAQKERDQRNNKRGGEETLSGGGRKESDMISVGIRWKRRRGEIQYWKEMSEEQALRKVVKGRMKG